MFSFDLLKCLTLVCVLLLGSCQEKDSNTWSVYKADAAGTSFAPLTQIDRDNVSKLEVAWTFAPKDGKEGVAGGKFECNPIVIDDVMYTTSARRLVYALDAGTGTEIWSFDPFDGGPGGGNCRGVTYWSGEEGERILFTADEFMYALDAHTGLKISSFGDDGRIPLDVGLGVDPDLVSVKLTTPGIIYDDLIIVGSAVGDYFGAAPGHIRAYNVISGEMEWIFHTIPQPGELGHDTWPEGAWKTSGSANNWAGMCLDVDRAIVYAPLGSPTYDFYGADRHGQNLFGNCLVALDARTGKLKWHFQTVHHDLWDYDLPAPPTLVTVEKEGVKVDAVSLVSKIGFVYFFDRETGEPIFPIEERPVAPSDVEGEAAWPTQPFPTKPAPLVRQTMTEDDITDLSTGRDTILARLRSLRSEGLFTPPSVGGTLMIPGTKGGVEYGGAAYDPGTGRLFVNANESPEIMTMQEGRKIRRVTSFYDYGEDYYKRFCVSCHREDKSGQPPLIASLVDLSDHLTKEEVSDVVRKGRGRMPAFSTISEDQMNGIIAYLFEEGKEEVVRISEEPKPHERYQNVTAYSYFRAPDGYLAIKPPWGTMNSVDVSTGEYDWRVPLGNVPEKQKPGAPETGIESWGGPMVTAGGLLFISATRDHKFRAFDSSTGDVLWQIDLPNGGFANPASYMVDGIQYVVLAVSATEEAPSGSVMAFALPK